MKLTQFDIQGYKSIRENQRLPLDSINVLLGENNAGKSSIIDALRDYKNIFPVANSLSSDWAYSRNTGKAREGEIRFELHFSLQEEEHRQFLEGVDDAESIGSNEIERWIEEGYFKEISHELILHSNKNPKEPIWGESNITGNYKDDMIPLRKGDLADENAEYLKYSKVDTDGDPEFTETRRTWIVLKEVIEESLSRWKFIDSFRDPESSLSASRETSLKAGGENLSRVLLTLRGEPGDQFEKISNEYSKLMPGVKGIRTALPYEDDDDHTTVVIDEQNYDTGFNLDEISAGSKEILTLITQIILSSESDVLFIEEPELHLHPGAERGILDLIKNELGNGGPQVILSTHSSIFIHHLDVENVYRVKRGRDTNIESTSPTKVGADLRELGYEYAGMFQSEGVVIVEGLTDRVALKEIGKKYGLNFDDYNIGILTMGSGSQLVSNSRPVVRLLDLFNIPYFFLCDSDIGSEFKNDDRAPPETPEAIEGRLVGHINSDNSRQEEWNDITPDDVHAWENTELEYYLLQDRDAVKRTFNSLDADWIDEILDQSDEMEAEKQLEAICDEARPELVDVTDAMVKKTDVSDLASHIELEGLPSEFHNTMEKIAKLVDAQHIISDNRPDTGDQ